MAEVGDEKLPENELETAFPRRFPRSLSKNFHRRFDTVEDYVNELGGSKSKVIEKVLIANNGVGAVKAIRYIRRWSYDIFGNERIIKFVVMATPEDLRANAEYIRLADVVVHVPGGSNNHNYANITLIVELARLHGVHAVWAGWGHASENPALPNTLAASNPPIKFIGPDGPPMQALGDKIGSTIIAQTAGVPCISWNGNEVFATYDPETGSLPQKAFEDASIATASEAEIAALKVGFPVMIKASEGGGGKGIRRVDNAEDVANAYRQVCGEVPGSPIFIMKLSSNSRHLEVQLLADEYGDAIALNGRDCSVQRRHQKIIEEGPPVAAPPEVWAQMEKAAVALAKAVRYANAGTVEYLYSEAEAKFYFLELNPRLQVEHPVTEMITKVNLPAAQLQVAMGIPLQNIPDIRELYGKNRFEDDPLDEATIIDFDTSQAKIHGHCMAVRITAENAEAGFKPSSGSLTELNFRSTPNAWGYFSTDSSGQIHEFADSQFGHIFANGANREAARRNMVLALKELSIRGDINTTVDYISNLIELDDFVNNNIDTTWLDGIIKENVDTIGAPRNHRSSSIKTSALHSHMHVVIGASIVAFYDSTEGEKKFLDLLEKGQLPPRSLLKVVFDVELILNGVKYKIHCIRTGPNSFELFVHGNESSSLRTNIRLLSDGGYLIEIGGNSHVAYLTNRGETGTGMRIAVGGANIAFSPDYDPTSLRSDMAGKIVKKLKEDGAHVKKGEPYCELEVMKMFMALKVKESGILSWHVNEGAATSPGDLLATLELDNPENVTMATVFEGDLEVAGWGSHAETCSKARPHHMLRTSVAQLESAMSGYKLSAEAIDNAFDNLEIACSQQTLPVFEIQEPLSVLSGRIPAKLYESITALLNEFSSLCESQAGVHRRFPSEEVVALLDKQLETFTDTSGKAAFNVLTTPLREAVVPYTKSTLPSVPGSERALQSFLSILRKWISVERWFCDGKDYADAINSLRKAHKNDPATVLEVSRAHEGLRTTCGVVSRIIRAIGDGSRVDGQIADRGWMGGLVSVVAGAESLSKTRPVISEIGSMGASDEYAAVALKARKLQMQEQLPTLEQRKDTVRAAAKRLVVEGSRSSTAKALLNDHIPMVDVFFSMIGSIDSPSEEAGFLELYLRHMYRSYTLKDFDRDSSQRLVKFSFLNKPSESVLNTEYSVNSMTDLTRMISTGSFTNLSELAEKNSSDCENVMEPKKERIPESVLRTGVCVILDNLADLEDTSKVESIMMKFPSSIGRTQSAENGAVNVLYLIVLDTLVGPDESSSDAAAARLEAMLLPLQAQLVESDVRRVSFVLNQTQEDNFEDAAPAMFTFRCPNFQEDSLFRRIDPSLAMHLDLNRVVANFKIKALGSRHTSTCHVHLYEGVPKPSALAKDTSANQAHRVFGRALSFVLEFSSSGFESILADALNALDLCSLKSKSDNHLFLNLVSDFEKAVLDPMVVEQIVFSVLERHGERISNLGIVEVETRIVCCLSPASPPIAIRLFASNPTGFVRVMNSYVEAASDTGAERVFKLIGSSKGAVAGAGDNSWDGLSVHTPYPLVRPFDAQRKAAARSSDTLYCYDLPALFEAAVEQQWHDASEKGGFLAAGRPLLVMFTKELVVKKKGDSLADSWTMKDYLSGGLELVQETRGAGSNDVGMVAWLVEIKTVEYPNGRQVVLVANDITHNAGSFGTREDVVFKLASEYAREKRIPRLFIAANSGARIGLASRVKDAFKVAFKDSSRPDNGFDFLYVSKDDYVELTKSCIEVIGEPIEYNGEEVYRITDIIGSEPDLGVENLKGSGLIAGETSVAYDEIFTMTIVLGRTVGIGAYLVRLGQRTIQKASASPIILTGYQALNKLMGVDVYSSNDQLGGPGIMYPNGISHIVVQDHLQAIKAAIDWISFVPSHRGGLLPVTDIRGVDLIDRPVGFTPQAGVPYDPRQLLAGGEDDSGNWLSGFFDRDSFTETLAGWAKTVVVGRARLGGIPMGVIITENRSAENVKPADPADVKASEAVIQEAGCVWFPNSAYKTAQAIKDFRTEDLPLIIFANWRGFSGGQRDMFDEVLKYGSLIVDAFVSYEQPVFVYIPPHAEIRGGAWVVLDASINASVMEMYAAKGSARGGVLEANGAASVKFRTKDLTTTMHRLDSKLKELKLQLSNAEDKTAIMEQIRYREQALLPVYEQIAVQFCELHDTPGRMKAVGVIEREVEWEQSRSFFYWRLRRKLAEFDLRKQLVDAAKVGRSVKTMTPLEASALIKEWFLESPNTEEALWHEDKMVLSWMAGSYGLLEKKILAYTKEVVAEEVVQVMTAGGNTARVGIAGIVQGVGQALEKMSPDERQAVKQMLLNVMSS